MPPPDHPKIFHITHVDNLREIVRTGVLWSDAGRRELGLACQVVGMSTIKERRLRELQVKCHRGTMVGEYVPFYLCPRSIMLYILHMANHPDIARRRTVRALPPTASRARPGVPERPGGRDTRILQ